ncbi:biopolymer transporter ExbD [Aporhodopirellula aestuarii]|uniref:Biopolymer transporter ExbD n=1 Tax=Aporhodopirellula aestuarii TaxID=2950107 RepID=A0ABT0U974_9BACT|nr:biopolymer transporter ExbD [Aporhodopirellula aestuarii]MCM2373326.1 biopolymer transporter ExbD [Aporhodopirellula aestuarii]
MSINVQCESCGMRRRVNERLAGRTIRCPGCEKALTIPALVSPPSSRDHAEVEEGEEIDAVEVDAIEVDAAEPVRAGEERVFEVEAVRVPETGVVTGGRAQAAASGGGGAATLDQAKIADAIATGYPRPSTHHAETPPSALLEDDDDGMPPRKKRDEGELDMTPMVDVTFLLLIFFMVTASFSLQKSIKMPRQNSDLPSMSNVEEPTEELDPIELEIEENGGFLVLAPEWEKETPGKHNLINALKEAIGANKDGMRLDIKVHENAKLQMLVDAMDAGTIAGFSEIQVAEVDGFD